MTARPWFSAPLLFAAAFSSASAAGALIVAAAASMRPALEKLQPAFTRAAGAAPQFVYGSSGKLAAQIKAGAPFDVFVSADADFPDSLVRWGLAEGPPRVYARGTLVLWTLGEWEVKGDLSTLRNPAIRKIALPDPLLAPYGRAAAAALRKAGLRNETLPRLVFGENVAQASQFILLRAADAGFTAKSVVLSPEAAGKGHWAEVDGSLCAPIDQAAVITRNGHATHGSAAEGFMAVLSGPAAGDTLRACGYALP
jgi:molybdate transport system substrate-binding protein